MPATNGAAPAEVERTTVLHERYDELMALRVEGRRKYGGTRWYHIYGPPVKFRFPQATLGKRPERRHIAVGPISVAEISAVEPAAAAAIEGWDRPGSVLEIGPGRGELAEILRARFPAKIERYYGLERDPCVRGPYARVDGPASIDGTIDLVVASEVIEHMKADDFASLLASLRHTLSPRSALVASLPNALSPGGIAGDFTHVQGWPWYDLYAVLRLTFRNVAVYRTYHVCGASRIALLPIRMLLSRALELDWCEALLFVADGPLAA